MKTAGTNAKGEALFDVEPLPPFRRPEEVIREALPVLAPVSRVTVSETAHRRNIRVGGRWVQWRPDVAPYMAEPMDMTGSRRFDSVAFVGPARSSKSEGLVISPLVHAILAQPRVVAVFSPSKDAAKEWSEGTLDPLVTNSPELAERLAAGRGADNIFTKRFKGGTRLTIDWPVKSKLAQRSIALCIGTDYDAFKRDIEGDGEAFPLMRKRTEDAGSRAMTVIESSPRFPPLNDDWVAASPHEAPPCEGIVAVYNSGTRGRLYWTCPDCQSPFRPEFEQLSFPDDGTPEERGARVHMFCPHCGCVMEARHKAELNAGGFWLHEDEGGALVPIHDLKREVATASYWLPGPAAALAPWSRLVSRYLTAEATFNALGDESGLKTVVNVELGLPYAPRGRGAGAGLSEAMLRQGASEHAWQICPAETAFVLAAVDVQPGRFVVQVEAVLPGLERVVIDRFDLFTPPPGSPRAEGRRIDPGRYAEDWRALDPLAERVYPVEGADYGLGVLCIVVDANGEPGVTPNAYSFLRRVRITQPNRWHLQKGKGGEDVKRAEVRRPETAHRGKQYVARDVPIIRTGTDRLKDEVAASLLREVGGARKLHIPRAAPAEVFAELAAERKTEDGWRKRPGVQRNEALDLCVYCLSLSIVLEAEAINWDRPPRWAAPGPDNLMAVALSDLPEAAAVEDMAPPRPAAPKGWAVKKPKKRW